MPTNGDHINKHLEYRIKDKQKTAWYLWFDFALSVSLGSIGLLFYTQLSDQFRLPENMIIWVSSFSLLVGFLAFRIVTRPTISIPLLWVLILINTLRGIIIIGILSLKGDTTTVFGNIFLGIRIIASGILAWLERNQIQKEKESEKDEVTN